MSEATLPRPTILFSAGLRRDGQALARVLAELGRLYQFHDRDCICCYDVSVTQCRALELLAEHGPMTLNDLAAALYLDKSTVSRVVDALERKEYARRQAHPQDGRAVRVQLSRRGRALVERIQDDLALRHASLLAEFPPEVRSAAIRLLAQLAGAAAKPVARIGGKCCVVQPLTAGRR
jgi:DNA-binding MarR family transcriptional regulator